MAKWTLSDKRVINLVHENEFKNLPNGTKLICINGSEIIKTDNHDNQESKDYIDKDTRGGYLAFGIEIV